jgi:hypothetical protein
MNVVLTILWVAFVAVLVLYFIVAICLYWRDVHRE